MLEERTGVAKRGLAGLGVVSTSARPLDSDGLGDFLLSLVQVDATLSQEDHDVLMACWDGDFCDVAGGFKTLSVEQIASKSDFQLLAMGLDRAIIVRLRRAMTGYFGYLITEEDVRSVSGLMIRPGDDAVLDRRALLVVLREGASTKEYLAGATGIGRRLVQRRLGELVAAGEVEPIFAASGAVRFTIRDESNEAS